MEPVKDSLVDLERYRSQLELNLIGIRRGLNTWQLWDAEYEALKEEIEAAEDDLYEKIQNDFKGELVQRKEVDEVIGDKGQRTKDQMINILDRRIDYVTRNIASLQKELELAEKKHATAQVISQPDEALDEDGQPITEIIEELDEDDNVVSYNLNRPAHNLSHVAEALKKAGVKDVPEVSMEDPHGTPIKLPSAMGPDDTEPPMGYLPRKRVKAELDLGRNAPVPKMPAKKGVSFAEDTKSGEQPPPKSRNAIRVENIMEAAAHQSIDDPVMPSEEDEEDAMLRQQMLKYSMNEVGAVVGELQLEDGSEYEDEDWEISDEGFDEEESDEDQYGRNGKVITDEYAQRMLELERRLGIQSRFTKDSRADTDGAGEADSGSDDERVGRIVVNHSAESSSKAPGQPPATKTLPRRPKEKVSSSDIVEKPKKKGVRFADDLDVSEAPNSERPVADSIMERESKVEPMSDMIVERDPTTRNSTTKSTRKPSRFKKAQTNAVEFEDDVCMEPWDDNFGNKIPPAPAANEFTPSNNTTPPLGPPDSTLADQLVERDYVSMSMNDFITIGDDEELEDVDFNAIATEHQNLRRKFIQREGGFLKEDENPIQPLDEEEGGPQRQSRFKAARLSRQ